MRTKEFLFHICNISLIVILIYLAWSSESKGLSTLFIVVGAILCFVGLSSAVLNSKKFPSKMQPSIKSNKEESKQTS